LLKLTPETPSSSSQENASRDTRDTKSNHVKKERNGLEKMLRFRNRFETFPKQNKRIQVKTHEKREADEGGLVMSLPLRGQVVSENFSPLVFSCLLYFHVPRF
jgi:hypothetical protein